MLPMINEKQIIDCTEQDLQEIVNNPDYRENEYIDYKGSFPVDRYPKSDEKHNIEISEFRSDICAFANAGGGYLILGVHEVKGMPSDLCGIEIKDDNPDRFELRLKNYLQTIQPRMPYCKFHFIELENGRFIVIILVHHDAFSPYIHLENEKDFRIYKRVGNSKAVIGYSELKNMFNQSIVLEKEIDAFRLERIRYYKDKSEFEGKHGPQFLVLHIFPDTFLDSSYNKPVFVINRSNYKLTSFFEHFLCESRCIPTVEGLRSTGYYHNTECRLNNNGVAECVLALSELLNYNLPDYSEGIFTLPEIWDRISPAVRKYIQDTCAILNHRRVHVCISVVGCENVCTEISTLYFSASHIDRDILLGQPVTFDNANDTEMIEKDMDRLKLEFMLSIGIRSNASIGDLIKKVYENDNK